MLSKRTLVIGVLLCAWSSAPGTAQAQADAEITGRLPVPHARRPITLTSSTIEMDASVSLIQPPAIEVMPGMFVEPDAATVVSVGLAYGILDDLEIGAVLLPLQLSPNVDYLDPRAHLRLRVLRGVLELGAEAVAIIPAFTDDFAITLGVPIRLHLGQSLRIDSGAYFPLVFSDPLVKSIVVPVDVSLNIGPNFFLGARTAFDLPDFDPDYLRLPFGAYLGYTFAGNRGPVMDLSVHFDWTHLLTPGANDAFNPDIYQASLIARFYHDLD